MKQTSMLIYYVVLKTEIDPGCISWKTMRWKSRRMKNCFERWPNRRQLLSGCFLFSLTAWDGFPSLNLYQTVFCVTEFRLWRLSRLLIWILPMSHAQKVNLWKAAWSFCTALKTDSVVSMGLTVNRQMALKLTVNRQKRNIFTVNRQMSEPKLAVKLLRYP